MKLANRPTGVALYREVTDYLERTGMRQSDFSRASGLAEQTISGTRQVSYPKLSTVKAVRNFMAAHPDGVSPEVAAAINPPPSQAPSGARAVAFAERASVAPARPSISAEEARASDAARRPARPATVPIASGRLPASEAVASLLVETPGDLIATVKRRWPEQWANVRAKARALGVSPAAMLVSVIERGLEAEA